MNNKERWSFDGYDYPYETLGELIDNHDGELEVGSVVYHGELHLITPEQLFCARDALELMKDRAYEYAQEYAEDFGSMVSKSALDELDKLVHDWINMHSPICFGRIKNVKEYVIEVEDF